MNTDNQKNPASRSEFVELSANEPIRAAQVICAALKSLAYWDISLQVDLLQISARHQESERKLTHTYQYEYSFQLTWLPQPGGIDLTVTVSEQKQSWQIGECHKRLDNVFQAVHQAAKRLSESQQRGTRSTLHGDARFAELKDLEEAGLLQEPENNRLIIGHVDGKTISIPEAQSHRHALVCGPTGSGKTWSVFIPNLLLRTGTSAIVTEARSGSEKAHLYTATAGYRASQGQQILHFDPQDMSSTRINPVDMATTPFMAAHTASLIMQNTSLKTHSGDQIWETAERLLLTALLLDANARKQHLGSIRWLLREGPIGMGKQLMESPSPLARLEYQSFMNNSLEGFRAGVVAGLMQRLSLWIIPEVVALTETTDFNPADLADQLFTFYLAAPSDKPEMESLMSLVFNYVLSLSLEANRKHPLALFLDEFVNYGRIPAMSRKLTMIRHSEISAVLGIQDYLQLDELYGKNQAQILFGQPASRVFFAPNDGRTAREISELLGKTTAEELSITGRGEVSSRTFPRWLMTTEEVLGLDKTKMLARLAQLKYPAIINRLPKEQYADKTNIPPPDAPEHEISERHLGLQEVAAKAWLQEGEKQQRQWAKLTPQQKKAAIKKEKDRQEPEEPKPTENDPSPAQNNHPGHQGNDRHVENPEPKTNKHRPRFDDMNR